MKNLLIILMFVPLASFGQSEVNFVESGNKKSSLEDYYGAIADYTKAIELDPDYANAYYNRGYTKYLLKDYYGAIADYSKVIELSTDDSQLTMEGLELVGYALSERGFMKFNLKDFSAAIIDYDMSIEINSNNAEAYGFRGMNKSLLLDEKGACLDWKTALNLDDSGPWNEWLNEYCK